MSTATIDAARRVFEEAARGQYHETRSDYLDDAAPAVAALIEHERTTLLAALGNMRCRTCAHWRYPSYVPSRWRRDGDPPTGECKRSTESVVNADGKPQPNTETTARANAWLTTDAEHGCTMWAPRVEPSGD